MRGEDGVNVSSEAGSWHWSGWVCSGSWRRKVQRATPSPVPPSVRSCCAPPLPLSPLPRLLTQVPALLLLQRCHRVQLLGHAPTGKWGMPLPSQILRPSAHVWGVQL